MDISVTWFDMPKVKVTSRAPFFKGNRPIASPSLAIRLSIRGGVPQLPQLVHLSIHPVWSIQKGGTLAGPSGAGIPQPIHPQGVTPAGQSREVPGWSIQRGYPGWSIQRGGTPAGPSRGGVLRLVHPEGGTPVGPSRGVPNASW